MVSAKAKESAPIIVTGDETRGPEEPGVIGMQRQP
jgi:hypothetical protein